MFQKPLMGGWVTEGHVFVLSFRKPSTVKTHKNFFENSERRIKKDGSESTTKASRSVPDKKTLNYIF